MPRCILIGIDGMDPIFAQTLMEQGRLPAFSRIREIGGFLPLLTSNPAQSPVAWSCIATGSNPGKHGIFDFITRDPATYLPTLSILKPNKKAIFGIRSKKFLPVRFGTPFWQITSENNIFTTVIKWPITFPPEKISANMLSGLGVPDIKNNLGRYTLFTRGQVKNINDRKGAVVDISKNSTFSIFGPNKTAIHAKMNIFEDSVELKFNNKTINIKTKEWSLWQELEFQPAIGQPIFGLCRFYLKSVEPVVQLYMTPIHINPNKPTSPISEPDSYCKTLAENIGLFHTLGLPEETNGLVDECFSHDAFLHHATDIQNEREKMFWHEFKKHKQGLLSFVFDTSDRLSHIFWQKDNSVLENYYEQMDALVKKVLDKLNKDDFLIILSDHGFSTFHTSIHVNSFLREKGWLSLKKGRTGRELFQNVDWKKTKAYAVGFSSIFLNRKGREKHGIVTQEESEMLLEKICNDLCGWEAIEKAYLSKKIYSGKYAKDAPDIVFGTKPGFRASWQTALGGAPENLIKNNTKAWQADHIIDPTHVPGVYFSNIPPRKQHPSVIDIAPTILDYFSITPPDDMEGESIL